MDEIQGELQTIHLGWENEGSGLYRQGCKQGEKERAVCKQFPFGKDTNELDTIVALKQKWYFRRDGENFLIPHLLLSTRTWVQHKIFKCSCSHYGVSVKHCWEFMHYLFTLAYNDIALLFRSRTVWDKCSTKGIWQTVEWMSSVAVVEESRGKHWNSVQPACNAFHCQTGQNETLFSDFRGVNISWKSCHYCDCS